MLLRHIGSAEERADQLLQRVQDSVRRRDALLAEVRQSVHADSNLDAALQEIQNVQDRLMPQYVHRSAALARTVAANASLAERSSKRVHCLDALLQRVQTTSAIVDAMKAMESDVAQVSSVLEKGDIEKTVQLLHSYEEAQRVLTSASPSQSAAAQAAATVATTASQQHAEKDARDAAADSETPTPDTEAGGASAKAEVSDVMRHAREVVHARLLTMIDDAVAVNDKLTIMKLTRLLAELGESATAARLYSSWIADHTIAALAKLIDAEMKKMDDPMKGAMSHLALVSQCLDNVAAAFESDEEFTREAFGAQGPLTLLSELHSRATARCVPVLSDFIERRKGVLAQLEMHASATHTAAGAAAATAASPPPGEKGRGNQRLNVSSPSAASIAHVDTSNANAVVASARRADQILEEISHIVSCGYIYLGFVQRKQGEYEGRLHKEAAAAARTKATGATTVESATDATRESVVNTDSLWRTRDNALLNSMQDILAFYVPLQNTYFTIAYDQAVELQLRAIREAASQAAVAAARSGTRNKGTANDNHSGSAHEGGAAASGLLTAASANTFMAGLQNLYSVAASSADELIGAVGVNASTSSTSAAAAQAMDATKLASYWYFTHDGQVTLPDDVFFVLRMAIHRAMNTKSAQICSAVVMSAEDVVESRLLPEIEKHTLIANGKHGLNSNGQRSASAASGAGTGSSSGRRQRTSAAAGGHGGFLTPDELHWTAAAQQTATYLQRLADELQQLSVTTFATNPRDQTRFRELASDMRNLGKRLQEKQIPSWLDTFADVCCDSVLPPHMERFAAVSYDMKEGVYYHYELNDAWVQACLVDLGTGLQYLHQHLVDPKLFDVLLAAMARRVARAASQVVPRKRFSLFGALQVDKDIRALRTFFVDRAQNDLSSIRDAFAVLNLMATLLLSDTPSDALEEAANPVLTSDEKKKVLLSRVEFRKEAIAALPL